MPQLLSLLIVLVPFSRTPYALSLRRVTPGHSAGGEGGGLVSAGGAMGSTTRTSFAAMISPIEEHEPPSTLA
jgi:hypothetical protein